MKKIVSLVLALMMACMLIPACAELAAETVVGDWYAVEMAKDGTVLNPGAMGMEITLILNEDGTMALNMSMMGETQSQQGTWSIEDGKVILAAETDEETVAFTLQEDGTLKGEDKGSTLTFSRESAAAPSVEFAEVNPDAKPEDFNGEWKFAYLSMAGITFNAETAATTGLFEEIPELVIQDNHLKLSGGSTMEMMFGEEGMDMEFADGGYGISAAIGETTAGIYVKMLQDGMVCITISMGQEVGLYFTKAE